MLIVLNIYWWFFKMNWKFTESIESGELKLTVIWLLDVQLCISWKNNLFWLNILPVLLIQQTLMQLYWIITNNVLTILLYPHFSHRTSSYLSYYKICIYKIQISLKYYLIIFLNNVTEEMQLVSIYVYADSLKMISYWLIKYIYTMLI